MSVPEQTHFFLEGARRRLHSIDPPVLQSLDVLPLLSTQFRDGLLSLLLQLSPLFRAPRRCAPVPGGLHSHLAIFLSHRPGLFEPIGIGKVVRLSLGVHEIRYGILRSGFGQKIHSGERDTKARAPEEMAGLSAVPLRTRKRFQKVAHLSIAPEES